MTTLVCARTDRLPRSSNSGGRSSKRTVAIGQQPTKTGSKLSATATPLHKIGLVLIRRRVGRRQYDIGGDSIHGGNSNVLSAAEAHNISGSRMCWTCWFPNLRDTAHRNTLVSLARFRCFYGVLLVHHPSHSRLKGQSRTYLTSPGVSHVAYTTVQRGSGPGQHSMVSELANNGLEKDSSISLSPSESLL